MSSLRFNAPGSNDDMASYIKFNNVNIDGLLQEYDNNVALLPESTLAWIVDDEWQFKWISNKSGVMLFPDSYKLKSNEKSILVLDLMSRADKTIEVNKYKLEWARQVEQDKKYMWLFDGDEKAKIAMLVDWVRKNSHLLLNWRLIECLSLNAKSEILIFFNLTLQPSEVQLCFSSVKKRWSQEKYRNSLKGKKQCNVVLTEKSLKRLDAMADNYLLSRAQVLEILIRFESEQKRYISEWVKIAKGPDTE
ncbi:hypothetical protein SAMN05660284_01534 [Formivibrio citricus]|uniref:Uncharacterized protein n=2 Tax=Formivibrio citricus TaxID=83765 RepID=A0A1I4Z5H3_9NEIS|nr:hypothetical protein SAMN05660284_01534 [Formivibrio citricus]